MRRLLRLAVPNGTSKTNDRDHDGDGVSNGVEFIIYGPVANSGFTALHGVDKALDGTLSVTWTNAAGYTGSYGVAPAGHFVVETSPTLAGPWPPESSPGTVSISDKNVTYTFPRGPSYSGKNFACLNVVVNTS